MKRTSRFLPAALSAVLAFLPAAASGQGYRARVIGRVADQAGAAVAGAQLTATNVETNVSSSTRSNAEGDYVIPELAPGRYRLSAEAAGYKSFTRRGVTLRVDQTVRIDVSFEAGGIDEQVLVIDEVPVIDTETSALGTVVTNREILDVPLNGRNYLSLAALSPGVAPAAAGANPYNINGARPDYVNYLIDGAPNINRRGNEPVASPSLDAIREFKVITNSFSAEYGRLAGGVISVALRGGTNEFRGSLFEFHRNGALDARGFFDAEGSKLVRNQFGATLGGPVARGRTFFFVGYEGLRNRQGQTQLARVPTPQERAGVFAAPVRNPFTGRPFAGNTIPAALLDPVALNVLPFIPLPNRGGALNFITNGTLREDADGIVVKLDHRFDEANQLTGRFLSNDTRAANPFRSTALPGFGAAREQTRRQWSLSYTRALSPTAVNEARFAFVRDDFAERSVNAGRNTSGEIGIPGVAAGTGLANIVVVGLPEIGDATFLPDEWTDNEYSVSDTLTLARGAHGLRLGGDFQRSQHFNLFAAFAGGQIAFQGAFTLNPFADFLLGLPVQTQRQVGTNKSYLFGSFYGLFVQDDWKVGRNLTLSLGLRYDVNRPPVEKYDRLANFFPDGRRQLAAGATGLPRSLLRTDYNNFSPRVGFAYRPFGGTKTAVRGGYGVFHSFDLQFTQYQLLGASAFPFTRLELFQAVAVGNPSLSDPFPANRPGLTPGALSPNGWDFENPTPYVQNWNLTLARELADGLGVEASYVGSKGTHLSQTANINQTIRTPQGNVVPFPGLGRVLYQNLGADSSYHALQVSVERRFGDGLGFRSSFTLSKSIDDASFGAPARLPQDPRDLRAERGLSEFDRRRVWVSDFIYEIPYGRGRRFGNASRELIDAIFGGWQLNGIVQLYDGRPFTPVASRANAQAGFATRPDRVSSGEVDDPTAERWFDPAAFAAVPAAQFRFGNSGRNILTGPGAVNVDASVFKRFALPWEGQTLQFRAEFFNLPNRANFGQPDARIDQPTAGAISSSGPGRQIQFAFKYLF
jgi:outer membrane receptor protein involved in Fe transport